MVPLNSPVVVRATGSVMVVVKPRVTVTLESSQHMMGRKEQREAGMTYSVMIWDKVTVELTKGGIRAEVDVDSVDVSFPVETVEITEDKVKVKRDVAVVMLSVPLTPEEVVVEQLPVDEVTRELPAGDTAAEVMVRPEVVSVVVFVKTGVRVAEVTKVVGVTRTVISSVRVSVQSQSSSIRTDSTVVTSGVGVTV